MLIPLAYFVDERNYFHQWYFAIDVEAVHMAWLATSLIMASALQKSILVNCRVSSEHTSDSLQRKCIKNTVGKGRYSFKCQGSRHEVRESLSRMLVRLANFVDERNNFEKATYALKFIYKSAIDAILK